MTKSKEIIFIKKLFFILGSDEREKMLQRSNLDEREKKAMSLRFCSGFSVCEVADSMNIPLDTFNKFQKRIFMKFYAWIERQFYGS